MRWWNFKVKIKLLWNNIVLNAPTIGAIALLIIGLLLFLTWFPIRNPGTEFTLKALLPDFYGNCITTIIGMGLTVLFFDTLNRIRDRRLERKRLQWDIACGDHGIALRAVKEITDKNYHKDGLLAYSYFDGAKLAGADLMSADLTHSGFHHADFTGTDLFDSILYMTGFWGANLRGVNFQYADLTMVDFVYADLLDAKFTEPIDDHLQLAFRLHGARLPDGTIYDGRYNLKGDIQDAKAEGFDVDDPVAMTRFYAIHHHKLRPDLPNFPT